MSDQFEKFYDFQNETALMRSFGFGFPAQLMSSINGYGCWCYFQDDHYNAKGTVQNEMDKICKTLQNGYQCIMMDDLDECIPWEIEYNSTTGSGTILPEQDLAVMVAIQCESKNRNSCAQQACKVEAYFSLSIVQLFFSGYQFEESYQHSNGFDPAFECSFKRKNPSINNKEKRPRNPMPPVAEYLKTKIENIFSLRIFLENTSF